MLAGADTSIGRDDEHPPCPRRGRRSVPPAARATRIPDSQAALVAPTARMATRRVASANHDGPNTSATIDAVTIPLLRIAKPPANEIVRASVCERQPRTISMVASVAMNAGTRSDVTAAPLTAPLSSPTRVRPATASEAAGREPEVANHARSATTEPTGRSCRQSGSRRSSARVGERILAEHDRLAVVRNESVASARNGTRRQGPRRSRSASQRVMPVPPRAPSPARGRLPRSARRSLRPPHHHHTVRHAEDLRRVGRNHQDGLPASLIRDR